MKRIRSIALSLSVSVALTGALIVGAASAVGCGGSVEQAPATTASTGPVTKAPLATQTHGMVKVFGDALADVPLRADQRTAVEALASDADARHAPLLQHRRDLAMAFADQIEKGAIDRGALQPKVDVVSADVDKVAVDDRAALVKLHDLLDAGQRNAFVDALQQHFQGKGHDFHAAAGQPGIARMKQFADDLKLTDDQRSQARELMHDAMRANMMKQHDAVGGPDANGPDVAKGPKAHAAGKSAMAAFREDTLDVSKLGPWGTDGAAHFKNMADARTGHMAGVMEKLLPLLTPEQRKLAADKLRDSATQGDAAILAH